MEKNLCEICSPKQWKTISSTQLTDKGYPVYGANGVIGYYPEYNHESETILVTCRGATCGTLNISAPFSYVNGNAMALDNLSPEIDIYYLFYFLQNRGFSDVITGSAQPQIVRQSLKKITVTYPNKAEQIRTVYAIQKVDNLISLRQQQLDKLDQLVKSRFVEMFGENFPTATMLSVCNTIVDCPHATPKYLGNELVYPAIRTSEICNGQIDWSSMKYVDKNEYEVRTKRLIPEAGDIVYAREGTYGDCVILPAGKQFCLGQRTMLFRPNYDLCTSEYLHQALRSENVKRQADASNAGSTVPHVNVSDAKAFKIPLPPIELQNQFTNSINQVNKSKFAIQQSLQKLETLKQSLMQEYFG